MRSPLLWAPVTDGIDKSTNYVYDNPPPKGRRIIVNVVLLLNDFSRSQAVTCDVEVVIHRKLCNIVTLLLRTANRKPYSRLNSAILDDIEST